MSTPASVTCRFCHERIVLNDDNEATRAAQIDPHQQLRRHLLTHPLAVYSHGRKGAWLLDMLAFNCDSETDRALWRQQCIRMLDLGLEGFPGL